MAATTRPPMSDFDPDRRECDVCSYRRESAGDEGARNPAPKNTLSPEDARDAYALPIALLLGVWLTLFALATVASALMLADAETVGGGVLGVYCVAANLTFFGVGCRWAVRYVTGRIWDRFPTPRGSA